MNLERDDWPPRILIVDDNLSIHRDFELVFAEEYANAELDADDRRLYGAPSSSVAKSNPYLLEHAYSGLEGLERVTRLKAAGQFFQVAFVDIRMPGIDGVETIDRLWRIDPKVQVVICTAYSDYSQDDLLHKLGVTDKLLLLKKPFDTIEITQLARTLSEKWYLARQAALKLEQMELLVARRTQRLLEVHPVPPASAAAPETEESLPLILLVEDNRDLNAQISQSLKDQFQVVLAENDAAGFDKAREIVPDLVIAGALLPHVNGINLCRRLKTDLMTSHIPVLLLSPRQAEDKLPALNAGAEDCVATVAEIKPRIAALLESCRQRLARLSGAASPLNARELALSPPDARFFQRTLAVIDQNLSDFEFDVDALAHCVGVSRRQLFRKLKALVDTTPKALIRSLRLRRAAQLMAESKMTITEIIFAVGFQDAKHFRALFKEEYGSLPSEYFKSDAGS